MSAVYCDGAADNQSYLMATDMNAGMYDGTSSESSASSPMNYNGYDSTYGGSGYMQYSSYPMQYSPAPIGLIPVELDIEGIYEDHDRRRRKNAGNDKVVASHVHSEANIFQRRRAQNRASQRAFRDRKEKHMRELEQRLSELEGRHNDLSRSYESLQHEYSCVKQELDRLREGGAEQASTAPAKEYQSHNRSWDDSKVEILDPLLFDVSAFCFDQDESEVRKE
ncbi:hypothetical protein B0O99DRAFT_654982 [Bisporella sp. PMI_857]|nr:hypothetical protein B0O99DRAFT_654982 [Bisporella sp. PMI_857]